MSDEPALPAGLELVRTTDEFDNDSVPVGLLRAHRVADGVWGRLVVRSGTVGFVFEDEPGTVRWVEAGGMQTIPPGRLHHLALDGPARFVVEFHRPTAAAGKASPSRVTAINIAPASRLPMHTVDRIEAEAGKGLIGDRYHGSKHRHVTIQAADELTSAGQSLGIAIESHQTRRNVTVSIGPIPTKPGTRAQLGDVELEVVRIAQPCKLLDDWIGPGAVEVLRGRSGSIFRVVSSGSISIGDAFTLN